MNLPSIPSRTALNNHKATLSTDTKWKLRFVFDGVLTGLGKRADGLYVVEAQFIEDEGYEPPQGTLHTVISIPPNEISNADTSDSNASETTIKKNQLEIVNGRWKLSEDPDDRKDGLWVWGLFKEPLYPFMLLELETKELQLPGEERDVIKPLQLYAQISHKRDQDAGVILDASTLTIREMETVKADPFGAATVDIYESVSVGQLSIKPSE